MKNLFKIACLVLITLNGINAQKKEIYVKNFDVNKETSATFNLRNISVTIEESFDDKIHFDCRVEFKGYSKKEIEDFVKTMEVKASPLNNQITLIASSENKMAGTSFELISDDGIVFNDNQLKNKKKNVVKRESLESIIKRIDKKNEEKDIENILSVFRRFDSNGNQKKIKAKDVKFKRNHFVIRIPSYVKLTIFGKNSNIVLNPIFENALEVILKNSLFRANELSNSNNNFEIERGSFLVKKIKGGNYVLNNVTTGQIGSVNASKIESEFSKIEIGEVGENVEIADFNGKLWFYDFSKDFQKFNLESEYSKVHLFYPKTDFGLKIMANNAVNITIFSNSGKSIGGKSRANSSYVLMDKKAKGTDNFSGNMNLEMDNGFTYLYEEGFGQKKE